MSLIVSRHNNRKKKREKGEKEKIKINSEKIARKMEENEINMNDEITSLKFFNELLYLFYKINKDKELFEGLDDEYIKILMNEHYKKIINLFK